MPNSLDIGATPITGGVRFRVCAPSASSVEVELVGAGNRSVVAFF